MSNDPFILITTNTIDQGQLERVQELSARFAAQQVLRMNAEQGATMRVLPSPVAGFVRGSAA
jgi:hypothetical protein